MITKITGKLIRIDEEAATLEVAPFEYEVLVPDFTRRHLQMELGNQVSLHTIQYIDGNPQSGGRLAPRLIGFTNGVEREFFELFCSVKNIGTKKALRAMVRPVQDVARAIEQQDIKSLSTLPGIGPSSAEKIVAELRRKMAKFALLVPSELDDPDVQIEHSIFEDAYQILIGLGYSEAEARKMIDGPAQSKMKFKDLDELLSAVLEQVNQD